MVHRPTKVCSLRITFFQPCMLIFGNSLKLYRYFLSHSLIELDDIFYQQTIILLVLHNKVGIEKINIVRFI